MIQELQKCTKKYTVIQQFVMFFNAQHHIITVPIDTETKQNI